VRLTLVAAAVAVAFVGAGCGSSDAPAPVRTSACELIARGDVAAALGGPVDPPTASDDSATDDLAGRSGCAFSTSDHGKAVLIELVRTVDMAAQVRRTGFSAAARYEAAASSAPSTVPVTGVGDRAFWVDELATLHVLAGGSYVTFEVATRPPADSEPTSLSLALLSFARVRLIDRAD
jgi:hypothetical protein